MELLTRKKAQVILYEFRALVKDTRGDEHELFFSSEDFQEFVRDIFKKKSIIDNIWEKK